MCYLPVLLVYVVEVICTHNFCCLALVRRTQLAEGRLSLLTVLPRVPLKLGSSLSDNGFLIIFLAGGGCMKGEGLFSIQHWAAAQEVPGTNKEELSCLALGRGLEGQLSSRSVSHFLKNPVF